MTIYESMLAAYDPAGGGTATPNAEQEVCQKITLAGLRRGGFFDHAAFYGGTCLRLFHGLPRWSEDMDFSLTEKRDDIHLENYFDAIREEFKIAGFDVTITKKEKKVFGRVESAFLKENTEAYDIKFQTKKMVKLKIELDTDPPLMFDTEQKLLLESYGGGFYLNEYGFAACCIEDGVCIIKELLCRNEELSVKCANMLAAELGCSKAVYYTMSDTGEKYAVLNAKIPPVTEWNLTLD